MIDTTLKPEHERLNLLLFSLGGVFFGIDADQVESIDLHGDESAGDAMWVHHLLGFEQMDLVYLAPSILTIRTNCEVPRRIIIDSMEDIRDYPWNAISPLPHLVEQHLLKRGVWGILHQSDRIVLLIDFQRLAEQIEVKPFN